MLDLEWHIETEHEDEPLENDDMPTAEHEVFEENIVNQEAQNVSIPEPETIACDQCPFVALDVPAMISHIRNDHTEENCRYCEF